MNGFNHLFSPSVLIDCFHAPLRVEVQIEQCRLAHALFIEIEALRRFV
jgi:hypothetical protein